MLTLLLCAFHGWDAVWLPNIGEPRHSFPWPSVFVGVWTGPDHDLLCVRRCRTAEDAERFLAPQGRTMLHAALLSTWARWTR